MRKKEIQKKAIERETVYWIIGLIALFVILFILFTPATDIIREKLVSISNFLRFT